MNNPAPESVIIGGGLAGSMVALELLRKGQPALLLEKTSQAHHKVCGEFLSHEALQYLQRHGINVHALGAVPIQTVRLVTRSGTVEAPLPFAAASLTRRRLDEEMLRIAASAGATVHRNCSVEKLQRVDAGWIATLRSGATIRAAHAFLATGKHDLRGWPRPPGAHHSLVAFKMYYRLHPQQQQRLGNAVELMLFPGGYAGMQPVEDGVANLCLVISSNQLRQTGGSWSDVARHLATSSPHLAERLHDSTPLLDAPLAASHIPYGHQQRKALHGLWPVGDQAAVIPSFCGDGMAIALHSAALAASSYVSGSSSEAYLRALHAQLGYRVPAATALSRQIVRFPAVAHIAHLFPSLLPRIAAFTRIPQSALLTGSSERE